MSQSVPDPTEDLDIDEDAPRALLTTREIEVLVKGKEHPGISENQYWVTRSRVRNKADRFADEFDLLAEELPDAAETIIDTVCDGDAGGE